MSEVLESLNIDKSFFVQFSIVLILFFSLKTFLFEKLLEVIKNRESKTTGLLSKSKEKESEAIEISRKIEEEIAETKSTLSLEIKSVKSQLVSQKEKEYSELEENLDGQYSQKLKEFNAELDSNFEVIKSQTKTLANDLVNKITQ